MMRISYDKRSTLFTALMALLVAMPGFYFIQNNAPKKYSIVLASSGSLLEGSRIEYDDLDHDGWSEQLTFGPNGSRSVHVIISGRNGIIGQWNFPGIFPSSDFRFITVDHDQNGTPEAFIFTINSDSLQMYAFDPFKPESKEIRKVFIERIKLFNDELGAGLYEGGVHDMNGDGFQDLVFGVYTTFSAYPRKVYIYDIFNNVLLRSDHFGAGISGLHLHDFDRDGKMSIVVENHSYGNTKDSTVAYNDHRTWLMVYDHNLKFRFEPVEIPGIHCFTKFIPHTQDGASYIIALQHFREKHDDNCFMYLFDAQGKLLKKM
ncbi:MAG: VCBS repeat-containing protein [Bacteroidales bacterium]|nr:VCBS repeat-containing protein [Bacteroidales bacterium]